MNRAKKKRRAGAAMVESFIVIMMLCFILFGILQVSYLIAAKDVTSFAALASARSATVGMREEFVNRVARVVSIPTAGPAKYRTKGSVSGNIPKMRVGAMWDRALSSAPESKQYWIEKYNIAYYLGAKNEAMLPSILNYYNWTTSNTKIDVKLSRSSDGRIGIYQQQYVPLSFPFAQGYYRGNMGRMNRPNGSRLVPRSPMINDFEFEDHSALYLTH
jgi:hypothetical protein